MSDEGILTALQALAESDREKEASPELEARLLRAFEHKRRQRAWRVAAVWAIAGSAAAAAIVVGIVVASHGRYQEPVITHASVQPATHAVQRPIERVPAVQTPRRSVAKARRPAQPREIVTQFFPLMDVPPPFEGGELLRVSVGADAMRAVGLPVDEDHLNDRVQADVLVGQEGLPRAIRFVEIVNQ